MNKKGIMMIKVTLFVVLSILIGALVIAAFLDTINRSMKNAEEQILAKDIGLTIMTVSASPYDIVYRYDGNTENYEIRIANNEVRAESEKGAGTYEFIPMSGIAVKSALIDDTLIIPIILNVKDGSVSFEDNVNDYSDSCSAIPMKYGDEQLKVKIEISSSESGEQKQKLEQISSIMKMHATQANSRISFVDSREDLLLILASSSDPEIKYYENKEDQSYAWYRRIACYISRGISTDTEDATQATSLISSSDESITLKLENIENLISDDDDMKKTAALSEEIYDAIQLGITG